MERKNGALQQLAGAQKICNAVMEYSIAGITNLAIFQIGMEHAAYHFVVKTAAS
jgi:hypothetical protein